MATKLSKRQEKLEQKREKKRKKKETLGATKENTDEMMEVDQEQTVTKKKEKVIFIKFIYFLKFYF
jgi:hypothetical protein